jgi:hypothetical protein
MKIILTNTQLQQLTNKIDAENLHEALHEIPGLYEMWQIPSL